MSYFDVKMPIENSWPFVESIGSLQMVHFLDSNSHLPASQTPGYNILTQCDTLELQLNQVESLCRQFNLPIQYSDSSE